MSALYRTGEALALLVAGVRAFRRRAKRLGIRLAHGRASRKDQAEPGRTSRKSAMRTARLPRPSAGRQNGRL